jgi:hypothetical protein
MEQLLASLQKWFDPHVLGELLLRWTGNVAAALAIFVVGRLVASWASRRIRATFGERGLEIPYPRTRLEQRPQGAE